MIDYEKLKNFVKEKHLNHPIAGFDHIERVHDLCLHLSEGLNIDKEHLRVAAYLHDIAVPPYGPLKHNEKAPEVIGTLLSDLCLSDAKQPFLPS